MRWRQVSTPTGHGNLNATITLSHHICAILSPPVLSCLPLPFFPAIVQAFCFFLLVYMHIIATLGTWPPPPAPPPPPHRSKYARCLHSDIRLFLYFSLRNNHSVACSMLLLPSRSAREDRNFRSYRVIF
jgi:hypothetical protein